MRDEYRQFLMAKAPRAEMRGMDDIPSLAPLRPNQCRWPIGEGAGFHFCDAAKESGSYCLDHAGRAYMKSREPEKRPDVSQFNFARY